MLFRYILITTFFLFSQANAEMEDSITINISVDDYCSKIVSKDPKKTAEMKSKRTGKTALFGKAQQSSNNESKDFVCPEQFNFSGATQSNSISKKDIEMYCICEFCKKNPTVHGMFCGPKDHGGHGGRR